MYERRVQTVAEGKRAAVTSEGTRDGREHTTSWSLIFFTKCQKELEEEVPKIIGFFSTKTRALRISKDRLNTTPIRNKEA